MNKRIPTVVTSGLMLLLSAIAEAGSAIWDLNPGSGDWNTAGNWTPVTVPNGPADTATFGLSNTTTISILATTVGGITFAPGASPFTFFTGSPFLALQLAGAGITNNSGIAQNFVAGAEILFTNSATAGNMTVFTINGGQSDGGIDGAMFFVGDSTAGTATITNSGGAVVGANGGLTFFNEKATAGSATIINDGGQVRGANGAETDFDLNSTAGTATITNSGGVVRGANGGGTVFGEDSTAGSATITNSGGAASGANGGKTNFAFSKATAGSATITNNGGTVSGANGGETAFSASTNAGSATLIANGGTGGGQGGAIVFERNSKGGTSRIEVFGNGELNISNHTTSPSVTVGSIEGDGNIFLGEKNLTVGSNNLSTTFSGIIQDGTGGSLTKIGTGTLDLMGVNTYTGTTIIKTGVLQVDGSITSDTVVNQPATLAGTGTIDGTVTSSGRISPAGDFPGILTIQNSLTLNSSASYRFELNSATAIADKLVANGVTINGAAFSFTDLGSGKLAPGTTFIIIDNTSTSPISGLFRSFADNSMFTNNGNIFQVSYEGGTGNDLTLTVVPEPSAWVMLGLGLAIVGALMRFQPTRGRKR